MSLLPIFWRLFESNSLVDCTIAAEGQYLKAHRVILSASSPYFKLLFTQENEKNPIVVVKDTKFKDLKAVIHFVYRGHVQVPQGQLGSFMATVESLQIKVLGNGSWNKNVQNREYEFLAVGNPLPHEHTAYKIQEENAAEMFPPESNGLVKTEEGGAEETRFVERNEENAEQSSATCSRAYQQNAFADAGKKSESSYGLADVSGSEKVEFCSVAPNIPGMSSTYAFTLENNCMNKTTEEGIMEDTQLIERNNEYAEQFTAVCCGQEYHFETAGASNGSGRCYLSSPVPENKKAEFCFGDANVPDNLSQHAHPSIKQNIDSTWPHEMEMCSVEPKDEMWERLSCGKEMKMQRVPLPHGAVRKVPITLKLLEPAMIVVGAICHHPCQSKRRLNSAQAVQMLLRISLSMLILQLSKILLIRTQCVKFKNIISKPIYNTSGVPQGSHLGPISNNIFINDMYIYIYNF